MEQTPRLRGAQNEITTHDEPVIYDARIAEESPLLTFAEAEQHNAFQLLTELHDHALTMDRRVQGAEGHLTELALSAAVVAWWSRWQPIAMHRALLAGASLSEVAAATGTGESAVYERWSTWATTQSQLVIQGRPSVEPSDVSAIRARIGAPPTP